MSHALAQARIEFVDAATDPWHAAPDAPQPEAHLLLTPAQWRDLGASWPSDLPVGLHLANDEDLEALEADLPRFAVIELHFPKWTDGRAYSQAHLLRSRLRYRGTLRAAGDVVADMLPLLARTGFDAVRLRADQRRETAQRALGYFEGFYQGDSVHPQPLFSAEAH
jgi:uncharacterized protein (DUF934 family)